MCVLRSLSLPHKWDPVALTATYAAVLKIAHQPAGDLSEIWGLLVLRTSDAHCLSSHFVLCRYCFYLALQLWVVWLHLLVFLSPRIMWSPNFVWVFGLGVAGFALLISLFLLLSLLMGRKRRQGILED